MLKPAPEFAPLDLGSAVLANLSAGRRSRRLARYRLGSVARLARLGRRNVILLSTDALLEGLQALAEVAHEAGNLAATAEQQQHDGKHD
jgi:hypothetical protein